MALSDTKILITRSGFDIDPVATDLLNLRVLGGIRIDEEGLHSVQNVDIPLAASDVTFVEMSDAGVISGNITGFTTGRTFLYEIETDAENIIGVKDWRGLNEVDPTLDLGSALSITPAMIAVPKVSVLTEALTAASMTDGGASVATKVLGSIPKGAVLLGVKVLVSVGFAGDTNALMIIGDGSDTDRYMTGTPNAFAAAANGLEMGVPSGAKLLTAANTPTVTITSTADATDMIAGGGVAEINIYYIETL